MDRQIFTAQQVAEKLEVSCQHIYELIAEGRLEAVNVSIGDVQPRWRISLESIERFKRENVQKSA